MRHLLITISGVLLLSVIQLTPGQPTKDGIPNNNTAKVEALGVSERASFETIAKVPRSCSDYLSYAQKYSDWDINIVMAVMEPESGCNTGSVGDTWVINGLYAPSCGLMQIRTLSGRPTCEQLKDPTTNIEWAHRLWKANGFQPWTMYTNGTYLKYL